MTTETSNMKIDYAKLDAAIVLDLHDRPRRGYGDFDEAAREATRIAPRGWDRVLDRRFQSLRKRGLIRYVSGFWRIAKEA